MQNINDPITLALRETSWLWMNKEINGTGQVTITDKIYQTTKLKKAYTIEKGIDAALVGISDYGIVVAFRGTTGLDDWLNDFNAALVDYLKPNYGKVHQGFKKSVIDVKDEVFNYINQFKKESNIIYITGHSKGGAMTALFAPIISDVFKHHQIQVISFAAPRVGDKTFKDNYIKQSINHTRYEYYKDIVPHVPFTPQERTLLPRLGTAFDVTNKLLRLPLYHPVGKLITLTNKPDSYDVHNSEGENLNSFCAAIRHLDEAGTSHIDGYL